jgi:hypothetical protein
MLTLLLPIGSKPGPYEVQIRDTVAKARASARGDADLRNEVTTLHSVVNLDSLSPGEYVLAVRAGGEHWQQFPLRVQ